MTDLEIDEFLTSKLEEFYVLLQNEVLFLKESQSVISQEDIEMVIYSVKHNL